MEHLGEEQVQALRPDALTPAQAAAKAVVVGQGKVALSTSRAFLLAVLAGIFIGFGASCMLVVKSDATLSFAVSQILSGLVFSVGLFLVVCAGAELFTGNSLMIMGVLEGHYSAYELVRAWVIVYMGNLTGALLLALLLYGADFASVGGGAVGQAALSIAQSKAGLSAHICLMRGILCNMLVCLAVWTSFSARTVIDKLCCCVMPVMAFVVCGFEHCVANMFFLPFGLLCASGSDAAALAGTPTIFQVLGNIVFATLGNIIGGALIIGALYWYIYLSPTRNRQREQLATKIVR